MERVPKKTARKGLKKRWIALILLLLLLAAGGGVLWARRAVLPPVPERAEQPMLLDRETEDVAAVAVEPREGLSYPLVRTENGFRLLGRESLPLRSDVVDEIIGVASSLQAEGTVADTGRETVSLADFGLEPAVVRAVITYRDGDKKELRIGEMTPEETPMRYCMVSGDPVIYKVLAVHTDVFFHELEYLREFAQPSIRGDLLDRIEVSGDVTFSADYTPSGWIMTAPYRYPLSTLRTDSLLSSIESMAFEACLGTEEEVNLGDYGLDQPALTVTLTQAKTVITGETQSGEQVSLDVPESRMTLLLGRETGKSGVYLWWDHAVYKASNFLLGFWKTLNVEDLLIRNQVNLLVNDLNRVSFTCGGQTRVYEVRMVETVTENNQIATDEYGRILYDAQVQRSGDAQPMDAAEFLNWYQRLAALTPDGRLPEGKSAPGGEPRTVIRLENDSLTREIAFYPYDALHSAMAVDGVCRFYVSNDALDALSAAP